MGIRSKTKYFWRIPEEVLQKNYHREVAKTQNNSIDFKSLRLRVLAIKKK